MDADFDLQEDGEVTGFPTGRGGKRPGAGRPKGYSPKAAKALAAAKAEEEASTLERTSLAVRKAMATTEKEEWAAKQAEMNFKKDSGEYLSRTAFREASATLLAEVAQAMRSLPDLLERKCALPPEAVVKVEEVVDDALSTLAAGLELFAGAEE